MRFFLRIAFCGLIAVPALAAGHAAPPAPATSAPSTPLMRWRARIDAARAERTVELFPKLIAHCRIAPNDADLAGYFALWRKTDPSVIPGEKTTAEAKRQIETWRLYHCISTYFDGHRYYARPPVLGGAPDMGWLEPVEALDKYFHAAVAQGLLTFSSEAEESYFFDRYESAAFSNLQDEDRAFTWLHRVPWQTMPPTP